MKGPLGRETEERLSLYLDGRLPPSERVEFERRIETDPELREALEFHRGLSLEFHEEAPPLPRGYAERARARLKQAGGAAVPAGAPGRDGTTFAPDPDRGRISRSWWRGPVGLSLAASAAALIAVLSVAGPARWLRSRPPEQVASAANPASADGGAGGARVKEQADQETIDALRSLGYLSSGRPEAAPEGTRKKSARSSVANGPRPSGPAAKTSAAQAPAVKAPAARESATRAPVSGSSQAPERARVVAAAPGKKEESKQERVAQPAATEAAAPARQAAEAEGMALAGKASIDEASAVTATGSIPFRVVSLAAAPGPGRDYLLIRTGEAWAAFAGGAGRAAPVASFDAEMLVVLRDDLERDPPERLRVLRVTLGAEEIVIVCRVEAQPIGADAKPAGPGQGVVLAADARPVRIVVN